MKAERIGSIKTNTFFSGYFRITDFVSEAFENLSPIGDPEKFVTVHYGNCRTTIYSPLNFGEGNIYQLVAHRRLINEKVRFQIEWKEQAFQDKDGLFGEPPFILDLAVAQELLSNISPDWDLMLESVPKTESVSSVTESRVIDLREPFWRKMAAVAPEGIYCTDGWEISTAVTSSESAAGIYLVTIDTEQNTIKIEPTRGEPVPLKDFVSWLQEMTGLCDGVERFLN